MGRSFVFLKCGNEALSFKRMVRPLIKDMEFYVLDDTLGTKLCLG
jgi:hypothetical protein